VDIRIKPDDPSKVAVRIEVSEEPVLRDGDVAELSLQGITGLAFINIAGATAASAPLTSSPDTVAVLPSKASSIDQLLQGAPDLLASANQVANRLEEILGAENQTRISAILGDVQNLTTTLGTSAPSVNRIVDSVDQTTANLARISTSVESLVPGMQQLIVNLNSGVERFDALMDRAETLTAGASTTLDEANSTLTSLSTSANTTLASVSGSFQVASDAVSDLTARASEVMTRAEGTLDDASEAVQAVSGVLNSDEGDVTALMSDLRSGVNNMSAAVEDLPIMIEEFRATARSFDGLAVRAGALVDDNTEAVNGLMGDGLNEFYRFVSESRRLVSALTRISDRLEREGARFLLPSTSSDGYVPTGANQ